VEEANSYIVSTYRIFHLSNRMAQKIKEKWLKVLLIY